MTDQTLQLLLKRLDHLTAEFQELRDGVKKAVRISDDDPEMALTRARKVLEYVVRDVFALRCQEDPGTRPLENLLQRLVKDGHLPKRLGAYASYIRDLGNVGTHVYGEDLTKDDVRRSFENLTTILEWYFERVRPDAFMKAEDHGREEVDVRRFAEEEIRRRDEELERKRREAEELKRPAEAEVAPPLAHKSYQSPVAPERQPFIAGVYAATKAKPPVGRNRQARIVASVVVLVLAAGVIVYIFKNRAEPPLHEVTTPSGLKYTKLVEGTGATPQRGQTVTVHYTGTLENGTKFDSSRDRGKPADFPIGVGAVIRSWDKALMMMKVGDRWKLVIPSNLGYSQQGRWPDIPGNATLIFDVELLGVK
jgi:hypothetical protein